MNLEREIIKWPRRYKPIPKPYYVVRCDDHCLVCKLDDKFNLIDEVSSIHWNKYVVRRWAFQIIESSKESL